MTILRDERPNMLRRADNGPKLYLRQVTVHAVCWLLYIAYELGFLFYNFGKTAAWSDYVLFYSINISLFYVLVSLFDTIRNDLRSYFRVVLLFSLIVISYLILKFFANYLAGENVLHSTPKQIGQLIASTLYRAGQFLLLALFYWAARHLAQYRQQAIEAENFRMAAEAEQARIVAEYAKAQNAYLQQQINPHLLFNSLNFVYSKIETAAPEAGRCVLLLSELLRYSIDAPGEDGKVWLEDEIAGVKNLIEIIKYRFDGALNVRINLNGNFSGHRIIPLVLLTLVENVFKHGNLTEIGNPGLINISISPEGVINFVSWNLKKKPSGHARNRSRGLENLRIRLQYAYPGNGHQFKVRDDDGWFENELTIKL